MLQLAFWMTFLQSAMAQPVGDLPRSAYYVAREMFRSGNVEDAADGFQTVLNNAARTASDGWIDSIPALVMLGECFYQRGNLTQALEHYNAALTIVLKYPGWLDQFNIADAPLAVTDPASKGINWFRLSRPSSSLSVPDSVQLLIDVTQARAGDQGIVIAPVHLTSRLDSSEVLKTLGVALIRRWQILGPLGSHSSLTNPAIQYFSQNLQQPHAWAQSSWQALRGLAMLARDEQNALQQLRSATLIRDQFDYFLSPLCLMAQGRLAALKGQYQAAIVHFQDASLLSAQYEQYEWLSESMLWLGDCGCANERIDLADSLRAASNWSSKRSPLALVACLIGAAELSIYAGNRVEAKKLTLRIASALPLRDAMLPRFQARLAFLECILALRENQTSVARNRLSAALALMRGNAAMGAIPDRIFQKQLALDLLASGQMTQRDGDQNLSLLLADPSSSEWEVQPLETLSVLTTPSTAAYLRWLKNGDAQDVNTLIARMDRVQQQQLYESLPLGGREYAWQTAVTVPLDQLPPDIRGTVQAEVMKSPALRQIPQQILAIVEQIRQTPIPVDDRQTKPETRQLYGQLEERLQQLDGLLLTQSVSRRSLRRFAPHAWNTVAAQQRLAPSDLLIGFVVAGEEMMGVAVNGQQTRMWRVADTASMLSRISVLYRQIGLVRPSGTKMPREATSPSAEWRTTAEALYNQLLPAECHTMIEAADRLILVPHSFLWYVPFELLITPSGAPLISSKSLAYAPTLGSHHLAYAGRKPQGNALAVAGGFFSLDKVVNGNEAKLVAAAGPTTALVHLDQKMLSANSFRLRVSSSELIVLNQLDAAPDGWSLRPIPMDAKNGGSLVDWFYSPQATPNLTLLPGTQTAVRTGEISNGDDVFLPVCGLLFGGSRGVISRWPVGGISSSRYIQRVRQEIHGNNTISGACRRAAIALWAEQFHTTDEPILKPAGSDAPPLTSGEHPLFWAGYMAIGDFLTSP